MINLKNIRKFVWWKFASNNKFKKNVNNKKKCIECDTLNVDVRCELCDSVIRFKSMRPALKKSVKDKSSINN